MRVFVTGGTGMVGSRVLPLLMARGHQVVLLTRRPQAAAALGSGVEIAAGDPTVAGPWIDQAAACDALLNLAGENIFGQRWTTDFKQRLRSSRVFATTNCVAAIKRNPCQADGSPKVLLNASAIGYYGPCADDELDEDAPPGNDLLASICVDWENAALPAREAGARLVIARIGVVLDVKSGALAKLLRPFKFCVGGPIGTGKQYLSWIHIDDIAELLCFALAEPAASGPMNVTAPAPLANKQFGKVLGKVLQRPAWMWTPGLMLRIVLGESAHLVLTGQRVLPKRALQWGFRFAYPELEPALVQLLSKAPK